MPKYLVKASYTAEGTRGLLKDGGTGRRDAIGALIESAGGTMEVFYYAFGSDDLLLICELPSEADLIAISLAINAAGGARVDSVPLIDIEDIDEGVRKVVSYRPPGS